MLALLESAEIAIDMLLLLPATDLVTATLDVISTQAEIIVEMANGRHYGDRHLDDVINHVRYMRNDIAQLKGDQIG